MDYNKLKTFVVVAEHGSITKAGYYLRRSQSAISQQMQQLEDELGLRLLERKGGRVLLSRHGEEVLAVAKRRLVEIDEAVLSLKHEVRHIEGNLRIGILNDFGNEMDYGSLVGAFCAAHPHVNVELTEGTSRSLERLLQDNVIDLSFQVYFQRPELVIQYPVVKNWHSLYTSPRYLDARGPFRTMKSILDADLVDITDDFICLGTFMRKNAPTLASSLTHRRPNIAAPNHRIIKNIVAAGFGIAILPDYFVEEELREGDLVRLLPSAKKVYAGLDLAHRRAKTLRLAEKTFIDFALAHTRHASR